MVSALHVSGYTQLKFSYYGILPIFNVRPISFNVDIVAFRGPTEKVIGRIRSCYIGGLREMVIVQINW